MTGRAELIAAIQGHQEWKLPRCPSSHRPDGLRASLLLSPVRTISVSSHSFILYSSRTPALCRMVVWPGMHITGTTFANSYEIQPKVPDLKPFLRRPLTHLDIPLDLLELDAELFSMFTSLQSLVITW